jgi:hypothetical protein
MTAQEKELIIPELESVRETEQARFILSYFNTPQCDFLGTSAI